MNTGPGVVSDICVCVCVCVGGRSDACVVSGACEEDPGAHRDVSGGERSCFL